MTAILWICNEKNVPINLQEECGMYRVYQEYHRIAGRET